MDTSLTKAVDDHIAQIAAIKARGDSATAADVDALAESAAALKALTGKNAPAPKEDPKTDEATTRRSATSRNG